MKTMNNYEAPKMEVVLFENDIWTDVVTSGSNDSATHTPSSVSRFDISDK